MNFLSRVEERTKKLHLRFSKLSLGICSAFVMVVLIDINYGYFSQMPLRSLTGIGKTAGSRASNSTSSLFRIIGFTSTWIGYSYGNIYSV